MVLAGDENKFVRSQLTTPTVDAGGGKSGDL
jgi:hypothetical protein